MSSTLSPDLARRINRALLITSLAFGVAAGCDTCCAEEPLVPQGAPPVCEIIDCKGDDAFRYGGCAPSGCDSDDDCCPGQRCRADLNTCFPRLLDGEFECETSADCADPAQVCATVAIGDRAPLPTCIYESCAGDSDCGDGFRSCYQHHCIAQAPCGGTCPAGSVCEINSNSCHPLPVGLDDAENGADAVDKSCTDACDGLVVLKNEGLMTGDVCCAIECECVSPPPIVPTRFGRYARIAVVGDGAVVSAYDAEFGDLVVVHFGSNGLRAGPVQYVDGIPLGGAVTNDPGGPRGGVRDAGPDVGTHTSIAVNGAGLARVAYHDVDGNSLKVAIETAPGVYSTHFVDGASNPGTGQVGTFTDIAVGADGTIFVSYLAHNTTLAGVTGQATGVKLARSRTPTPTSAADWELFVLDARAFVADPALRDEPPEMPRGRGLHTSIALDGNAAFVGYYDGTDGDVRVASFAGSSVAVAVVDGDAQGGRLSGDVGRYPAVGVTDGDLLVVYEDTARHNVRFWKGPKATPGTGGAYGVAEALRNENRSGSHFLGAAGRLSTEGARPVYVSQDASTLDLRFSAFDGAAWAPQTVLDDGANGFYADVAVSAGKAFVCSVVAELDSRGKERSRLRLDIQPLP